jgi:hypothetical protein
MQLNNLKKLTVTVPDYIYNAWGKSKLTDLLEDERWDMLQVDEKVTPDFTFFGGYLPFSSIKYGLGKKKPRMKFVQRVFFRQDHSTLDLGSSSLSEQELEENDIDDSAIAMNDEASPHRFWPTKAPKLLTGEKRKTEDGGEPTSMVKRVKAD